MIRMPSYMQILMLLALIAYDIPVVCGENDEDETFVVIKAGRVITLAGEEHINGEIVMVDGKIRLVGRNLEYPKTAKVIDARRKVVMPGMILCHSRWQLPSYSRSGVHGDRSVAKEIYLDEIDFQPLLKAGFTAVCYYPAGTGIPGPSVVYRTAGDKEQRELGEAYLRVTMSKPQRDKKVLREAVDKARKEIEKVNKARKEWEAKQKKEKEAAAKKKKEEKETAAKKKEKESSEEGETKKTPEKKDDKGNAKGEEKKPETFTPPKIDPAVKPIVDWIRDKKGPSLLFELSRASDLRHLDDVLKRASELPNTLLYLSTRSPTRFPSDYHHIVKDLGMRKASVLLHPEISRLPHTVTRYNLPAELVLARCTVAIVPASEIPSELANIRVRLAELVRSGLSRGDALRAVTLNVAKVVGMEDRLGTIVKDKDADFIVLDGDPLAPVTRVTCVIIHGEIVWEAPE
ncbi:MAG: amidohydrolase family protein [Phycisphaerales bacterium]|nr:MAG: amidohydrolase family protein [Phycisphaerales bacterium]